MQENQSREQYFFEDETLDWLAALISRTERVGAVFMPSLLRFPNVWAFDADERFAGSERFTLVDVTRQPPDLSGFGMVLVDPPFALSWRHLEPMLVSARRRPLLISATDWCVERAGWGELFRACGLTQVTAYFPRYRSIGNGYCESALKRDGRTNISFFSNIPFSPARRSVVLKEHGQWWTHDPYEFRPLHSSPTLPDVGDEPAGGAQGPVAAAAAKAIEIEQRWETMQRSRQVPWKRRLKRLLRVGD